MKGTQSPYPSYPKGTAPETLLDNLQHLELMVDRQGLASFREDPKRRGRGLTVNLHDDRLFSAGKDGIHMVGLDGVVSPLEFTVVTTPVLALGPVADVGKCIRPWDWNDYIHSVDVSNVDGDWDAGRTAWQGSIREHIRCAQLELLTTDLTIDFRAQDDQSSTGFELKHSVNDVLLKDDGQIVARASTASRSLVHVVKTVEINPSAPPALLGKLSKPILEMVLQAWMLEFTLNYLLKGPPDEAADLVRAAPASGRAEWQLPDEFVDSFNHFLGFQGRSIQGGEVQARPD